VKPPRKPYTDERRAKISAALKGNKNGAGVRTHEARLNISRGRRNGAKAGGEK
jgi:hypothetical protein